MKPTQEEIIKVIQAEDEMRIVIAKAKGWSEVTRTGQVFFYYSPDGYMRPTLPNWSDNISAAWELFDELPLFKTVMRLIDSGFGGSWYCGAGGVSDEQGDHYLFESSATTAPLAICAVWLKWTAAQMQPSLITGG